MYLHETQRQLNVRLDNNHSEKMYRGFCSDHPNQRGKSERAPFVIRAPNNKRERR